MLPAGKAWSKNIGEAGEGGGPTSLRSILVVLDAVVVLLAMWWAFFAHEWLRGVIPFLKAKPAFSEYALLVYLGLPLWLALIQIFKVDCAETLPRTRDIASQLFKVHLVGAAVIAIVSFAGQIAINRSMVLVFLISGFVALLAEKWSIVAYRKFQHRTGSSRERMLILGDATEVLSTYIDRIKRGAHQQEIVGVLSSEPLKTAASGAEGLRLGDLGRLESVLHDLPVDRVVYLPPYNSAQDYPGIFDACELRGIKSSVLVHTITPLHLTPRIEVHHELPFMTYELAPKSGELLALKGLMDLVLSLAAVVILAPLFVLVALGNWMTMGRPILFVQNRIGLGGRNIRVYKFRTMVPAADQRRDELLDSNEMDGPVFKIADDPRITPFGRFLRRTSLDELPQLFNVLVGEMSLVGPRPLPVQEQRQIHGLDRRRLSMKPGITGLWQVSGRNDVGFEEWMKLDREYVEQWTLLLDLKILFKTVGVVLSGKGAR